MNRELFVSSTPHEIKVGLVEDDQLAEIYMEREGEYSLAGSIYKGRVTRVLPGMQSAFVDIGLERDAFLYVSDFFEIEDHDEIEEVPARPVTYEVKPEAPATDHVESQSREAAEVPEPETRAMGAAAQAENQEQGSQGFENRDRGRDRGWRGRRRRRGRRGFVESKYGRPESSAPAPTPGSDYGPPPGYQPILLPGESISKYNRAAAHSSGAAAVLALSPEQTAAISVLFPDDEPEFAKAAAAARQPAPTQEEARTESTSVPAPSFPGPAGSRKRQEEEERFEQRNVASVFGGEEAVSDETAELAVEPQPPQPAAREILHEEAASAANGAFEEEEIEEEEAEFAAYAEDIAEDDSFEEMEEETREAEDYVPAAPAETSHVPDVPVELAGPSNGAGNGEEFAHDETVEETQEAADELEEIQEEAEAIAAGDMPAEESEPRAEVRASAGTAGFQQRTQRQRFERGGRGRRGPGRRFRPRRETQPLPLISDLLKEGQEILVQIAKEPIGKKGARITSHIALPGRFLVYMPTVHHTGVSRKIASEEERQRLKRIVLSERENGQGGFIVRTAAQGAAEEELRADIRFLKGLWNEIKQRAEKSKAPAIIYHDLNVVERVLRDQVTSDFSQIWVDSEQEYERILRFANRFQPSLVRRVKLYTKETPLFEQFGLKEEIDKALKSKVWLKSGGYIVINQTEALVAIDVNTGKYVGKTQRLEDTIVKTNVDAIKEIVRQIRLRDLGGIIVIDFIDMDERRNRQKVMQALEEALRHDRAPSKALQFNDFGLVAITRKRVKQSLERTIGTPCPYCTATGFVKSPTTVCNEIYVELRKMARHLDHPDVMVRVNPEVAKALKANNGRWLQDMEEITKKTIIVKSDPALHQEQFDIN
jgi:ribonuclease G